ncbi:hypothetical protein FY528_18710 [Hymenobacter lutimineralis]|uniref:Uncharacterized protein n=1 Tax=Hymenobacter lutimineralis TaxID=2606448 RepID=A0A5D6URE7_9BACT|nr:MULTISPECIES: glycine zipper domain-containing protein [Hymenobacter]QIX62374.1 glycine zipper 2TM domain-containing protein [Hymenobacter sp. BT18]TYZ06271.1 hypothetical protein FY528_18710 [Hymenobacter lutimineralis]
MKKISWIFALVILFTSVFGEFAHAQDKKKVSPQAKGAIIGGLGGAAAGAIIHKRNRVVGGAVGGAAGAGVGYVIGKRVDNKRKAEAARVAAANRAAADRAAYRASVARANQAKTTTVATKTSAAAPMALAAGAGVGAAMLYDANGNPVPYGTSASGLAYLPNDSYGDRDSAYPDSQVRRKSW